MGSSLAPFLFNYIQSDRSLIHGSFFLFTLGRTECLFILRVRTHFSTAVRPVLFARVPKTMADNELFSVISILIIVSFGNAREQRVFVPIDSVSLKLLPSNHSSFLRSQLAFCIRRLSPGAYRSPLRHCAGAFLRLFVQ